MDDMSNYNSRLRYNDGTYINTGLDITGVPNLNPVVTYNSGSNVIVGWTIDDRLGAFSGASNPPSATASLPVGLICDTQGKPIPSPCNYMEIPDNPSTNDYSDYLSLAGRFGNDDVLMTFYNGTQSDVYQKQQTGISSPASQLRNVQNLTTSNSLLGFLNENQYQKSFQLKVFDLSGRIIKEYDYLSPTDIINKINIFKKEQHQIYIIEVKSLTNGLLFHEKI